MNLADEISDVIVHDNPRERDYWVRLGSSCEAVMRALIFREDLQLRIYDGCLELWYAKSGESASVRRVGFPGAYPRPEDWNEILIEIGAIPQREPWYVEAK